MSSQEAQPAVLMLVQQHLQMTSDGANNWGARRPISIEDELCAHVGAALAVKSKQRRKAASGPQKRHMPRSVCRKRIVDRKASRVGGRGRRGEVMLCSA